jgi:flagellar basal-body rod protein FlgC
MRLSGLDISASALTANRLRMDVVASNIANADVTRGRLVDGQWVPYQRKLVSLESKGTTSFNQHLNKAMGEQSEQGVRVSQISNDQTPFKKVYNPTHPDADAEGYVLLPNVDTLKEMVDMISATRSYEANVTAINASKAMFMKALEIGK